MLGTWGGERRLRRKGGCRARIEVLLAVWGQSARVGDERLVTSPSLGVKEPTFLELRYMLIPLNQVVGIFRSRLGFRTPEGRGRHQINRVWRQESSNLSQRDKHITVNS